MIDRIKNKINFIYSNFRTKLLLNNYKFKRNNDLIRLGSVYGGWNLLDKKNLTNSTILSCGLGEDASFDVEFAKKYSAKVIIVDPTPRSKTHYEKITKNIGRQKIKSYNSNGHQDVGCYDLSELNKDNLILIDKALYNKDNLEKKFFKPPNIKEISHSINNWQNDYSNFTDSIIVSTITIETILKKFNLTTLPLIKLDIEGAEIEVLEDILKKNFCPSQICVEFDELNKFTKKAEIRFLRILKLLTEKKYEFIETNSSPNFLFNKID